MFVQDITAFGAAAAIVTSDWRYSRILRWVWMKENKRERVKPKKKAKPQITKLKKEITKLKKDFETRVQKEVDGRFSQKLQEALDEKT